MVIQYAYVYILPSRLGSRDTLLLLSQKPPTNNRITIQTAVSTNHHSVSPRQPETYCLAANTILAFLSLKFASRFSALSSHLFVGSTALELDSASVGSGDTRFCKLYFAMRDSLGLDDEVAGCAAAGGGGGAACSVRG